MENFNRLYPNYLRLIQKKAAKRKNTNERWWMASENNGGGVEDGCKQQTEKQKKNWNVNFAFVVNYVVVYIFFGRCCLYCDNHIAAISSKWKLNRFNKTSNVSTFRKYFRKVKSIENCDSLNGLDFSFFAMVRRVLRVIVQVLLMHV